MLGEVDDGRTEVTPPLSPEGDPKKPRMPEPKPIDLMTYSEQAQEYIRELRRENKERREYGERLQAQLNDLSTRLEAIDNQRVQQMEQDGNWRELAVSREQRITELQPVAERAKALEQLIRANNESRIAALPERARKAIPTMLAPEVLAQWLDEYSVLFTAPAPPEMDGGKGTRVGRGDGRPHGVTQADIDQAEFARSQGFNVTAEQIAARRANPVAPTKLTTEQESNSGG